MYACVCVHACSWCNKYCSKKWTWQPEFNSCTRLNPFHSANTLGEGMTFIQLPIRSNLT